MGKKCDLCNGVARMYCESDEASLCWDCDGKVHGANFLVAKHTRCLLCNTCQSLTPWKATGLRLSPTFSVCESCENQSQEVDREDDGAESYDDDEDEEYSDDEEEAENQVVPQPPSVMSSSDGDLVVKRSRDYDHEDIGSSSSSAQESNYYSRPLKRALRDEFRCGAL